MEPARFVLADPAWTFRDVGSRMAPSYAGSGRKNAHYEVSGLDLIKAAGGFLRPLIAADCFLGLWAPHAMVLDGQAQSVAHAWGFTPKQEMIWIKTSKAGTPRIGGGHYSRLCSEALLLCTRGRPKVRNKSVPNVFFAERTAHSAKPDESYRVIERLCEGPYIELYARRRFSPAWTAYGRELKPCSSKS